MSVDNLDPVLELPVIFFVPASCAPPPPPATPLAARRGARSGWAAAVLDPAGVWQAVCGGPDPVAEQTARLAEDVRQSRWELKALRTAAGPTEVRRIEVPVDRVVYVPVVEVRPKEVVVERLEEVEPRGDCNPFTHWKTLPTSSLQIGLSGGHGLCFGVKSAPPRLNCVLERETRLMAGL